MASGHGLADPANRSGRHHAAKALRPQGANTTAWRSARTHAMFPPPRSLRKEGRVRSRAEERGQEAQRSDLRSELHVYAWRRRQKGSRDPSDPANAATQNNHILTPTRAPTRHHTVGPKDRAKHVTRVTWNGATWFDKHQNMMGRS